MMVVRRGEPVVDGVVAAVTLPLLLLLLRE